jgi:hypothetical protein
MANFGEILTDIAMPAGQSIRRNAGDTAFEAYTPGSGGTATVQDEGVTQSTTVTTFNFTGSGVTASGAGSTATINIPGGSGATTGQATVNFGANTQEDQTALVTVNTASALTASKIFITPAGIATADHDPDDYVCDMIGGNVTNIVNGVSFDIVAFAPNNTWGQYVFNYQIN